MEEIRVKALHEEIKEQLRRDSMEALRVLLDEAEPHHLAEAFYHFNLQEQLFLLQVMETDHVADLLPEVNDPAVEAILEQIPDDQLARLVEQMEPDDAVHLISLVEPGRVPPLLERVDPVRRERLTALLTYGEETAGRIMDPDVVRVIAGQTVAEALEDIREYVERVALDDFFTIFVVDETGVLEGAVPNWKMLLARPNQTIGEIMIPDVVVVEASLDQEQVGALVRDHDLVTVPVVDHHRRLVGRITVDDVVDVIQEEYHEDVAHLAGTRDEDVMEFSVLQSIWVRTPWLLFAMMGLFLSAMIMHRFEGFFVAIPQLAFFIPLVMALGGNTGIQSSSLVIRGLATGEVRLSHFWRRVSRELAVSLGIGCFFLFVLLGGVWLLTGQWRIGISVALATATGIVVAAVIGTSLPMILKRLDFDPALATGPFLTTLNDIIGIVVYLLVIYLIVF